MLAKIFGLLWIVIGILFFIKPHLLRKKLQAKGTKKLKKQLFTLTLVLSIVLILAALKATGLLPKIIVIVGIIGIFKAFLFLSLKASDKMISWSAQRSLNFFRFGGVAYIVIGIILLNFS